MTSPPVFAYKNRGRGLKKKKPRETGGGRRGEKKNRGEEKGIEEKTKRRRRSNSREENEKNRGEREGKHRATPLSAPLPVATSISAIDDSHHRSALYPLSRFTVHLLACRTCTVHVLQAMN